MDERYVGYREHTATKEELSDRIAKVELEQARMNAALMHLPGKVDKLGEAVNEAVTLMRNASTALPAANSSFDQATLAMQHAAQALSARTSQRRLSAFEWAALALIAVGVFAIANWMGFVRLGGA